MTLVQASAKFFEPRTVEEKRKLLTEIRALNDADRVWFASELTAQLGEPVEHN